MSINMSIFVPKFVNYALIFNIIKIQSAKNAQRSAGNAQEFEHKISLTN